MQNNNDKLIQKYKNRTKTDKVVKIHIETYELLIKISEDSKIAIVRLIDLAVNKYAKEKGIK